MRLHYKAREVETPLYVDAMRLFLYMCKYFKYPVCYPVIRVGEACKDKEACLRIDGLLQCSIVPPERPYHPVLPFISNRISFSACVERSS